ncbi:DUF4124 domain-containing protein [Bacterioplanoides sp.]|uniref:DUF4124 domain-containing protein n=1 Tax=Bacterioplanoides sp. TaxID=2066072 RepID=UPI003B006776
MRILSVVLLLVGILTPLLSQAGKVYKWTDENGQVHFSSQPPRGLNQDQYNLRVDKVTPPPKKTPAISADVTRKEQQTLEAEKQEIKSTVSKEKAAEYCAQARDIKAKIAANFNRRFKQDDGSYRPLTDAERASWNQRADKSIADYCK